MKKETVKKPDWKSAGLTHAKELLDGLYNHANQRSCMYQLMDKDRIIERWVVNSSLPTIFVDVLISRVSATKYVVSIAELNIKFTKLVNLG